VFAARALKSAIFGTPAPPPGDDTVYEIEQALKGKEKTSDTMARKTTKLAHRSLSPTRPPGILLTPGTAITRRKTVSFGNEVVDKDEEKSAVGRGKPSTPYPAKSDHTGRSKPISFPIQKLESAREEKLARTSTDSIGRASDSKPLLSFEPDEDRRQSHESKSSKLRKGSWDPLLEIKRDDSDGDITTDLNEPHSQSGRFWKAEYEQYHEEAKAEMEKLVRYKTLAKKYAKTKDAEAIDLSEKLKEEQRRVASMEDKISELSFKIAAMSDDDSPDLIKELARRTALTKKYKGMVEDFRVELEGNGKESVSTEATTPKSSTKPESRSIYGLREHRKSRDEGKEMELLRDEVQNLRKALSIAEKNSTQLQEENTKLTQELLHSEMRLETHLEKCEKKRRSFEGQREKREATIQGLHKDYDKLKEQAKAQRRDAEQLLKKRHDQVVGLKKEIASLKGADSSVQELQLKLQKQSEEHQKIVKGFEKHIEELRGLVARERENSDKNKELPPNPPMKAENSLVRESLVPVLNQSVSRPSKILAPKQTQSDILFRSLAPRSTHSALSEIINGANADSTPPPRSGPVQHTPLVANTPVTSLSNRFSNLSMDSPQLPSPEESIYHEIGPRVIHERNCHASPRPSMFNIASSPPKAAMIRSKTTGELSRKRSVHELADRQPANTSTSRLSSMDGSKARAPLPPDRAAAARARLEQKNMEKRRAQALGDQKENIMN
jgi:hypothetical protein